jgi:hypothetical protein
VASNAQKMAFANTLTRLFDSNISEIIIFRPESGAKCCDFWSSLSVVSAGGDFVFGGDCVRSGDLVRWNRCKIRSNRSGSCE